jgi:hypothetical protein
MAKDMVTIFVESFRTAESGAVDPRSAPAHR